MQMRKFALLSGLLFVLAGAFALPANADTKVSFGVQFKELDDYGEWFEVDGYGEVWRPYADDDWRPFTYGHWAYSRDGWLWVADEPFGWIVCHYGNWYSDDELGWVWVPGYDWSPARVEWHVTDDEIGWAPLFPPAWPGRAKISVRANWVFCPAPFFTSVEIRRHVVIRPRPAPQMVTVKVYSGPPRIEYVRRVVKAPVIRVTPKKVRITKGNRSFIRVEVKDRSHRHVEVPVGRKYKKVIVRHHEEPRTKVIVKDSRSHHPVIESDSHRVKVQSRPDDRINKIHVENGDRDEEKYKEKEYEDQGDDSKKERKVKVHVKSN